MTNKNLNLTRCKLDNSVDGSSASVAAKASSSSNVRSSSKSFTIISTDGSNKESPLLVAFEVRCDVEELDEGELAVDGWITEVAEADDDWFVGTAVIVGGDIQEIITK